MRDRILNGTWVWAHAGLAAVLLMAVGCGPTKVTTETSPYAARYQIRTLAVLPFDTLDTPQAVVNGAQNLQVPSGVKRSDIAIAVPSDTHGRQWPTSVVDPKAGETVTRLVWERLGARAGLSVKSLQEASTAVREAAGIPKTGRTGEFAAAMGKKLGVDGVVTGIVRVYQERVGSRIGAESAAVGFEMTLTGLDGRTLWVGNYYEKQRPMTEDLQGFFERRGAFVTAAELAAYGVDKVLQDFPYGRNE